MHLICIYNNFNNFRIDNNTSNIFRNHFKHLITLLKNNALQNLTILLNSKILHNMKRSRYLKRSLLENKKVNILEIKKDPKLFLTFSKDFMTLTLFFKDNHYDDSQIIIDKHKSAIKWSNELFNYYKEV